MVARVALVARAVKDSILSRGLHRCAEDFRIHPKGTGGGTARGVPAQDFVSEYIGELYPPWRWFERQDAVAAAQRALNMPPSLPDFYNIVMERPCDDKVGGYGLLYVDASKRANYASSLSHSCTPNCEPRMAVRQGRLCIVLVTLRACSPGEELTFDYGAVTSNIDEYRLAVCLCGTSLCRQAFLDFVASDSTQQLLTRWHSHRTASRCSSTRPCRSSAPPRRSAAPTSFRFHGLGRSAIPGLARPPSTRRITPRRCAKRGKKKRTRMSGWARTTCRSASGCDASAQRPLDLWTRSACLRFS